MVHKVVDTAAEQTASEGRPDTSEGIVGVNRAAGDGRSYGEDSPYTPEERACSEGLLHNGYLAAVEAEAWAAAHGALRADGCSSCPGRSNCSATRCLNGSHAKR